MENIYINGIGLVYDVAKNVDEFWSYVCKYKLQFNEEVNDTTSFIPSTKSRRMDRLSILAVASAKKALEDSGINDYDPHDVGTIFNSDYCHNNSNLKFGQYILEGTPDLASPTNFTNTVNNACVGHVCINLGLKGCSTMLVSSNYVGYAVNLIKNNRVKIVIAGGVEEYCKVLFDAIKKKNFRANECGVSLVLSEEKSTKSYCEIVSYHENNLGGHPYFSEKFNAEIKDIENVVNQALEKARINRNDISAILTGCCNSNVGNSELLAIDKMFSDSKPIIQSKTILGDTMGASLGLNLSLGALILRNQLIPDMFSLNKENIEQEYKYLLVNNYTLSGGFTSYILKK